MKPSGPIPPHFSTSEDGQLMIGGRPAEDLVAEAGGTPLFAYDNNIVGSQIAARRAIEAGERIGTQPKIAVRVNPPFSIDKGRIVLGARPTPFGVDAERVPALVQGLIEAGVDWRGLHIFAAAQCLDDISLIEAHRAIIACAGEITNAIGVPLPELNLGGGFDVPCFAGEQPIDLYRLARALHESI